MSYESTPKKKKLAGPARFTYHCSKSDCGQQLKSNHSFEGSLGTWKCPQHGHVPAVRREVKV